MDSMTDPSPLKIAHYPQITRPEEFARGPVDVTLYQHQSKPITYEVCEYHDSVRVRAFTNFDGILAFGEQLMVLEMFQDIGRRDALCVLFKETTQRVELAIEERRRG